MVSEAELLSKGYVKKDGKYVLEATQTIIDRRGVSHGTKTVTYPVKEYQLGPGGEVQVYREYSYKGGKARVVLERTPEQTIEQEWSPSGERVGGKVVRDGVVRDIGKERRKQERIERARQVRQPPLSSWEGLRMLTLRQHPEELERERQLDQEKYVYIGKKVEVEEEKLAPEPESFPMMSVWGAAKPIPKEERVTSMQEYYSWEEREKAPLRSKITQPIGKFYGKLEKFKETKLFGTRIGIFAEPGLGVISGAGHAAKSIIYPIKTAKALVKVAKDPLTVTEAIGERLETKGIGFVGGEFLGAYATYRAIGKGITKGYDVARTRGLQKIDPPVTKEVMAYYESHGAAGKPFPSAPPKTHKSYFMHPREGLRLPSTPKKLEGYGFGFHATGKPLKSAVVSEKYGQLFFSGKGVSIHFLRIPKGYAKPSLVPKFGRPVVYAGYFKKVVPMKAVEELKLPSGGRYYVFPKPTKQGIAYLPLRKTEVEAIVQPGTQLVPVAKRFYFELGGRRVPIIEQAFTAKKDFGTVPLFISKAVPKYQSVLPSPYAATYSSSISSILGGASLVSRYGALSRRKETTVSRPKISSRAVPSSFVGASYPVKPVSSAVSVSRVGETSRVSGSSTVLASSIIAPSKSITEPTSTVSGPFRFEEDRIKKKKRKGKYKKLVGKRKPSVWGITAFKETGFSVPVVPKGETGLEFRPVVKGSIKVRRGF